MNFFFIVVVNWLYGLLEEGTLDYVERKSFWHRAYYKYPDKQHLEPSPFYWLLFVSHFPPLFAYNIDLFRTKDSKDPFFMFMLPLPLLTCISRKRLLSSSIFFFFFFFSISNNSFLISYGHEVPIVVVLHVYLKWCFIRVMPLGYAFSHQLSCRYYPLFG